MSAHFGAKFCALPAILMSSTYTDRNKPCSRWKNIHSQFGMFSHPSSNEACSNCHSHNNPAKGCPEKISIKKYHSLSPAWAGTGEDCHPRTTWRPLTLAGSPVLPTVNLTGSFCHADWTLIRPSSPACATLRTKGVCTHAGSGPHEFAGRLFSTCLGGPQPPGHRVVRIYNFWCLRRFREF